MPHPRFLGVLLCYNDADILEDVIDHLLSNRHEIVVWNHGSTDDTASILERRRADLLEVTHIGREVDFYDLYPLMSKHLMTRYVDRYDWVSWPDQDEILEGPARDKPYSAYLDEAVDSRHNWIEFQDFVFWFTDSDDHDAVSPCQRIRHYALAEHGAPKIRAWRASATNVRWFNHNKTAGSRYPVAFKLRHYPMRSAAQMRRRLSIDRAGLQRGPVNAHYEHMKTILPAIDIKAADLHGDDGRADLDPAAKFDWARIYGSAPALPLEVTESFLLSTRKWEVAGAIHQALGLLPPSTVSQFGRARIDRWLDALGQKIGSPVVVALKRHDAKIVTEDAALGWERTREGTVGAGEAHPRRSVRTTVDSVPVTISADASTRSVRVVADPTGESRAERGSPLVALVPCYGRDEIARLDTLDAAGGVAFECLPGTYYYLSLEPRPRPM